MKEDQTLNVHSSMNQYDGKKSSSTVWWPDGTDVYVSFIDIGGDPGYSYSSTPLDNHGWDLDGDGPWIMINPTTPLLDPNGYPIRDPDDLVPTVVFKKVDP
jgi:hypothetical protein